MVSHTVCYLQHLWPVTCRNGTVIHDREAGDNENRPKRCQTHHLGPRWVFILFFFRFFFDTKSLFSNKLIAGFSNKSTQICVTHLWESMTLAQSINFIQCISPNCCEHLQFTRFHGAKSSGTLVWGRHKCPYRFSHVTTPHSCGWNRLQTNCLDWGCNEGQCTSKDAGLW